MFLMKTPEFEVLHPNANETLNFFVIGLIVGLILFFAASVSIPDKTDWQFFLASFCKLVTIACIIGIFITMVVASSLLNDASKKVDADDERFKTWMADNYGVDIGDASFSGFTDGPVKITVDEESLEVRMSKQKSQSGPDFVTETYALVDEQVKEEVPVPRTSIKPTPSPSSAPPCAVFDLKTESCLYPTK